MRILPVELACYASEEEISKAIVPLVEKYFPGETQNPQKVIVFLSINPSTLPSSHSLNAVIKYAYPSMGDMFVKSFQ